MLPFIRGSVQSKGVLMSRLPQHMMMTEVEQMQDEEFLFLFLKASNWRSPRVAKCQRYGRYICVKILEGWGKKCGRPYSFVNWSNFWSNSTNYYEVLSLNHFYVIEFSAFSPKKKSIISILLNLSVKFVGIYALFLGFQSKDLVCVKNWHFATLSKQPM